MSDPPRDVPRPLRFRYSFDDVLRGMPIEAAHALLDHLADLRDPDAEEFHSRLTLFVTKGDLESTFRLERDELAVLWRALRDVDLPPGSPLAELRRLLQRLADDGGFD